MRKLTRFAVPVALSLIFALAVPAAVPAQSQQSEQAAEEMPETIDGKMVHKVTGTVVEYEPPMVAEDIKIKDDVEHPDDAPHIKVYMLDAAEEYPDRLEPGATVNVWYTTDDAKKNWGAKIEITETEGTGTLR